MAVNCWVAPAVMLGVAGETEIEVTVTVAAVTVSVRRAGDAAHRRRDRCGAGAHARCHAGLTHLWRRLCWTRPRSPKTRGSLSTRHYKFPVAVNCCVALTAMLAVRWRDGNGGQRLLGSGRGRRSATGNRYQSNRQSKRNELNAATQRIHVGLEKISKFVPYRRPESPQNLWTLIVH